MIQVETQRVTLTGFTRYATEDWMQQIARNLMDIDSGALRDQKYLLHDGDTKFCEGFRSIRE